MPTAGGRWANTASLYTRAWWTNKRDVMYTVEGPPWRRVRDLCLVWRLRRIGSKSVKDSQTQKRSLMNGMDRGLGGMLQVSVPEDEAKDRVS